MNTVIIFFHDNTEFLGHFKNKQGLLLKDRSVLAQSSVTK
jgi:hypothetical protein